MIFVAMMKNTKNYAQIESDSWSHSWRCWQLIIIQFIKRLKPWLQIYYCRFCSADLVVLFIVLPHTECKANTTPWLSGVGKSLCFLNKKLLTHTRSFTVIKSGTDRYLYHIRIVEFNTNCPSPWAIRWCRILLKSLTVWAVCNCALASTKFTGNLRRSFPLILLTDRQTNSQIWTKKTQNVPTKLVEVSEKYNACIQWFMWF